MFVEILILVILISMNAFFAASEIALISLNDNKIKIMAKEGHKKAILLVNLLSEPSRFLATIQIGITLAGFLASAFASESFAERFVELIKQFNLPISDALLKNISVVLITIILSYFTLVFGELVPKRFAMKKAEPIAMFVIRPLSLLLAVTFPFVRFLTLSTNLFVRLFGVNPHEKNGEVTEEEIRMMVDVGEENGTIHEDEKIMINNIFEFNNKTVVEIMTHRTDITALPITATMPDIISCFNQEKFSRIPVYENSIDNIVGVLYAKDLIKYLDENENKNEFKLREVVKEAYFIPFSKRTDELLRELKSNKIHMAVIIDEYGGTAGIVSLEDLLEEIVGNIFDEYDIEEKGVEVIDENTIIAKGNVNLETLKNYVAINFSNENYDTLSGFVIGKLGKIPSQDDKTSIEVEGFVFKIEEMDDRKLKKIRITKKSETTLSGTL